MNVQQMHGDGQFITGAVRIVDFDLANNNVLVRGSAALGTPGFEIDQLTNAITNDSNYSFVKDKGIILQQDPLVIDFCLIGFSPGSKDNNIVDAELGWFTSNLPTLNGEGGDYPNYIPSTISGHQGVMVYWPILAVASPPPCAVNDTWAGSGPADSIGSGPNQFNFSGLIPAIRNALTNQISLLPQGFPSAISAIKNAIIYIHCDSGVNRTGAAVTGYLMTNGSNLSALSIKPTDPGTPYDLSAAQHAANNAPPSNDTPIPGGSDIPVAAAYCNFLQTSQMDAPLVSECVPIKCMACSNNADK